MERICIPARRASRDREGKRELHFSKLEKTQSKQGLLDAYLIMNFWACLIRPSDTVMIYNPGGSAAKEMLPEP